MFSIYDPRKKNDFVFKGLLGGKIFSTVENNTLLFHSSTEAQARNSNIVFALFKEFYPGDIFFLFTYKNYKNLINKLRELIPVDQELKNKNYFIFSDIHDSSFGKLASLYEDVPTFEDILLGSIKKEKIPELHKFLKQYEEQSTLDSLDFFLAHKAMFNCLFLASFEGPELYLMFFDENKFSDIIRSIPLA